MLDHKYKVFYHLAQTPNTTKVAEELLLSQPAISKNIKELEKRTGYYPLQPDKRSDAAHRSRTVSVLGN